MSTNEEFVIRCTPADREWPSYRVRDESGEVIYFETAGLAHSEACDLQEESLREGGRVEYSVEVARSHGS